jgi:cation/acetate symporter
MLAGLGVTGYYMVRNEPWLRGVFSIAQPVDLWFGIQPISAGLFGVGVGLVVMVIVSWLTPAVSPTARELVQYIRYPKAD